MTIRRVLRTWFMIVNIGDEFLFMNRIVPSKGYLLMKNTVVTHVELSELNKLDSQLFHTHFFYISDDQLKDQHKLRETIRTNVSQRLAHWEGIIYGS